MEGQKSSIERYSNIDRNLQNRNENKKKFII